MAFNCGTSCSGEFGTHPNGFVIAECSGGDNMVSFPQQGLNSCGACRAKAESMCEQGKANLTSGISRMRSATGISEKEVGRTMAIYAYAGVFAGTLALYKYLDLFKKDKTKLLIGYGIVFAGLALGSAVGSYRVEQKRKN